MRRGARLLRYVALAWALTAVAPAASLAGRRGRHVDGIVTDTQGKALQGVKVVLEPPGGLAGIEAGTDEDGRWSASGVAEGDWQIYFSLDGYVTRSMTRTIYASRKRNQIRIQLEAAPPGATALPVPGRASASSAARTAASAEQLAATAAALAAAGQHAAALELYLALLAQDPQRDDLHQQLGNEYMQLGWLDKAQEHYQRLYELDPQSPAALSNLAEVYLKRNDIDNALVFLDRLIQEDPTHPTARYNMAELLLGANEPAEAIVHYEAAIASRPDWAEAHLRLGYAALSVGQSGKALAAFEKYLTLAPDGAEADFVRDTMRLIR